MSLEKQEVLVTGTIPYDDLLEKIKKTGKTVRGFLLELRSIPVARCLDGIIFGVCDVFDRSALGRHCPRQNHTC